MTLIKYFFWFDDYPIVSLLYQSKKQSKNIRNDVFPFMRHPVLGKK